MDEINFTDDDLNAIDAIVAAMEATAAKRPHLAHAHAASPSAPGPSFAASPPLPHARSPEASSDRPLKKFKVTHAVDGTFATLPIVPPMPASLASPLGGRALQRATSFNESEFEQSENQEGGFVHRSDSPHSLAAPSLPKAMCILAFDFETSDWPDDTPNNSDQWRVGDGRVVQIGFVGTDETGATLLCRCHTVCPAAPKPIPQVSEKAVRYHAISQAAVDRGEDMDTVLWALTDAILHVAAQPAGVVLVHSRNHEWRHLMHELRESNLPDNRVMLVQNALRRALVDTLCPRFQTGPTAYGMFGLGLGKFYYQLFGSDLSNAHNAAVDCCATISCYIATLMNRAAGSKQPRTPACVFTACTPHPAVPTRAPLTRA